MKSQKSSLVQTRNKPGKKCLKYTNHIVDGLFVVLMLMLLLCAIYIKMDSDSVYQAADPKQWVQYKPDYPDDVVSFEELQRRNPDVLGWLTVYGTNIDYPILYSSENNSFYLMHNALKEIQASGSVYLDYRNKPDWTDFNNVLHGHHMSKHEMFGDLGLFFDEQFFNTHEFGRIYYNNRDHGFQIVAAIATDGYNWALYAPGIETDDLKRDYINAIYKSASFIRGIDKEQIRKRQESQQSWDTSPITISDKLFLFSTCNMSETNGRYLIVAKELDYIVDNPFKEKKKDDPNNGTIDTFTLFNRYGSLPLWIWIAIIILLIIVTFILYRLSRHRDRKVTERRNSLKETDAHDENED